MDPQEAYETITEANYKAILSEDEMREGLIDEILIDEELFSRLALSYANEHLESIPDIGFLDYAANRLTKERTPEYRNGWTEDD